MRKRTLTVWLSILAVSLVTLVGSLGFAQQGGGGNGGGGNGGNGGGGGRRGGGGGGNGGGGFDPAAMQQRMADGVKALLGATDDEWKVIEPLWTKVQTAQTKVRPNMRAMFGGRGGRGGQNAGGADAAAAPAAPTAASQGGLPEADALQKVLADANAKPEEIKAKLDAYRAALKKANDELKAAREDLRKVLTPKQEAQLVLTGTLD